MFVDSNMPYLAVEVPRLPQGRLGVSVAALTAGLVNLFAGGAILKAWVFNAGQAYYDSLFRSFWLPEGIITLPNTTITAAGYDVLRNNTEIWIIAIIYAFPAACFASMAVFMGEWLVKKLWVAFIHGSTAYLGCLEK